MIKIQKYPHKHWTIIFGLRIKRYSIFSILYFMYNLLKYNIYFFIPADTIELRLQSVGCWKKLVYNEFWLKGTVRTSWRTHLNKKDVLLKNARRWLFFCFLFFFLSFIFIYFLKHGFAPRMTTKTSPIPVFISLYIYKRKIHNLEHLTTKVIRKQGLSVI